MSKIDEEKLLGMLKNWPIPPLESVLADEVGLSEGSIGLVMEFMYRTLLSMYDPKDQKNMEQLADIANSLQTHNVDVNLFDCFVIYQELSQEFQSGSRVLTNPIYMFSPSQDREYKEGVGGFAQVRASLLAEWYPE